jgi:hypothetical protein
MIRRKRALDGLDQDIHNHIERDLSIAGAINAPVGALQGVRAIY